MNALGYERLAILSTIDPDNQAASTVLGDWFKADKFQQYMAILQVGAMTTGGFITFVVRQATDIAGAGAKDLKTVQQLSEAAGDSDKQVTVSIDPNELDTNNSYQFVNISIETSAAASLISGIVLGINPTYGYDAANDLASVDEQIGPSSGL